MAVKWGVVRASAVQEAAKAVAPMVVLLVEARVGRTEDL